MGLLLVWGELQGATIKKINRKKSLVLIDAGKKDGLSKGIWVCFYEMDTKVGCGKVLKVGARKAFVKTSKKTVVKLKKNMEVIIREPRSKISDRSKTGGAKSNINVFSSIGKTPSHYDKLAYREIPAGSSAQGSLWEKTGDSTKCIGSSTAKLLCLTSIGIEFQGALSKSSAFAVGARYKIPNSYEADSWYTSAETEYVVVSQKYSAFGLWVDYHYWFTRMGPLSMSVGSGLDVEMSTVAFNAKKVNETNSAETELASYSSKLTIVSLRALLLNFTLPINPFGLGMGLDLVVPLLASGASKDATINDSHAATLADAETDLKDSLNHKKASFSYGFRFIAQLSF